MARWKQRDCDLQMATFLSTLRLQTYNFFRISICQNNYVMSSKHSINYVRQKTLLVKNVKD